MSKHRRAVLFDLYGTLADVKVDEHVDSFWDRLVSHSILRESGLNGGKLRDLYFSSVEKEQRNGAQEGSLLAATFERLLNEAGVRSDKASIREFARVFRKESTILLKEKPYARQVLETVKSAGYALGLISNTEELLTDYDLDQLHLKPLFDLICLSSQTGTKKPDPRIFTTALERIGVKSEEAVFVGDDFDADVRGATDAGLDVVFLSDREKSLKCRSTGMNAFVVQCKANAPSITKALCTLGVGRRAR